MLDPFPFVKMYKDPMDNTEEISAFLLIIN